MSSLSEKDFQFVWHPFTQMKTAQPPLPVVRAEGVWLFTEDGKKYLDANSSWWTNINGHGNKYIADKIYEQFLEIDHVIFAGVTHPKAVELSERILKKTENNFQKVFFSDNGSTSVEVALKMVYQYWYNLGQTKKRFLAIQGAYHGDTFGAMSVGERGYFNKPFEHLFFDVDFIDFPTSENGNELLKKLERLFSTSEFAGFIFEPLVQGAAGMRMYDESWLDNAISLAKKHNVLTIGDEVMTGFYRTGKFLATNYLTQKPDIICLSKGLTGGVLPLGLTLATQKIFDAFLHEETTRALLHGHSFTGNAIACAAACASLDLLEEKETIQQVEMIASMHHQFVKDQKNNPAFKSINPKGTILSIELKTNKDSGYFTSVRDEAYNYFLSKGFIIRPLGNVIFLNPPYCISEEELQSLYQVILEFAEMKR
ncbi:MAG: adenosylmethionine--8-amino-7-oxononanoate transaminase [Crocinitomicaceae bacterium]|nr:adenosylmethionine--8-amino-7-oxononanoate transaminase [Crocinitomicaceae bacterium]